MKLTKCENKHYYDGDRYSCCPHCLTGEADKKPSPGTSQHPPLSGSSEAVSAGPSIVPSQPEKIKSVSGSAAAPAATSLDFDMKRSFSDVTVLLTEEELLDTEEPIAQAEPVSIKEETTNQSIMEQILASDQNEPSPSPALSPQDEKGDTKETSPEKITPEDTSIITDPFPPAQQQENVQENASEPSADDKPERITPVYGTSSDPRGSKADRPPQISIDSRTIAYYGDQSNEIVTGWLVCTKGIYAGQSFNLHSGRNFIGRSLEMDLTFPKEPSISRNKHAIITYDPIARAFTLQAGESSGLTYHNKKLLITYTQIESHDVIQLGYAEFIFVPLCGKKFDWEDYPIR